MNNSTSNRLKTLVTALLCGIFISTIPLLVCPGLNTPEPVGKFFNNTFPSTVTLSKYYVPVFPNLTFDSPLSFNEVSNNRIIVGQRDGKMFWFNKSDSSTEKNLTLDLSDKVGLVWDGGMMSAELHPKFGTPGFNYFYTYYSTKDENGNDFPNSFTGFGCNRNNYYGNYLILARFELDPITLIADKNSEQILIKRRLYETSHRGGAMQFGDDGFLYIATGDQIASSKSQDIINNLDGAILRIDVDQDPTKSHEPIRNMPDDHGFSDEISGNGYWIPNDNPFLSQTGALFEEYYALGKRNPHRMTKDKATGKLYIGDVGAGKHDEINVLETGGKNYGWPVYEGLYESTSCVPNLLNNMAHEEPLTIFPRSVSNSLIGGYVYRGSEVPEMQGRYICADYGFGEEIWSVNIDDGSFEELGDFESTDIISFGQDLQGELYLLKEGVSTLFKFVSPGSRINNSPNLLSETGVFSDLITLTPAEGLIPYELIESFWSDGALKKRWMVIPNDGLHDTVDEKINFSEDGDWQFPVGSVLIKHFELPIDERNPTIIKRLETRFSIKAENGDFYYLTYKWNDEQNDAQLLGTSFDENIPIIKANGSSENQIWHYPNYTECISCHKSFAGGTLGTRTRYLNNNMTYPKTGISANQLVTLSHLGVLDQSITDSDTGSFLTYKAITNVNASLEEKARSYLDINCAYCHRSDNIGNRANFDLRLNKSLAETGLIVAETNQPLGIPGEKIIVVGDAEKSILYHRINSVTDGIAMPPIAKNKIDEQATQLIEDWINQLEEPFDSGVLPNGLSDLAEGVYYIENKLSGKVVEVTNSSLNDESNIQQNTNIHSENQMIRLTKQGSGYYVLSFEHSGKALEASYNGKTSGTNVWQYTSNANEAQLWGFKYEEEEFYQIVGQSSNLNLDVSGGVTTDGANIQIWTPNGTSAQSWKLTAVDNTTLSSGSDFLINRKEPSLSLSSNPVRDVLNVKLKNFNSNTNNIEYSIYTISGKQLLNRKGNKEESFVITNFSKGYYIITSKFNGSSLTKKFIVK